MLTERQIRLLLKVLEYETIFDDKGIRLQKLKSGYANDFEVEKLQRSLYGMLEAAVKAEVGP